MPDPSRSAGSRPVVLTKLGGSLITDKSRPGTARPEVIRRLAEEVATALPRLGSGLVMGHGSGSFGHVAAARYGLRGGLPAATAVEAPAATATEAPATARSEPPAEVLRQGVPEVQAEAAALHRLVLQALRDAGVPAFSVAPSSAAVAEGGAVASFAAEPVARALEAGLVPVVYGDVAVDRERGAAILSTEATFGALALRLPTWGWRVCRVLWLGATEGVYDADGRVIPEIPTAAADAAREAAGASAGVDVTGGMAHRLVMAVGLAAWGIPSWIGDGRSPGSLERALLGAEPPGTRVVPPPPK